MWQEPIFDRTNADTLTARAGQSNIVNHKGALNYQDLNRIEGNFQYVVQHLFDNAMVIPHTKREYTETIFERAEQEVSILPDGYTQVEYIESSGTQHVDTGVSIDANTAKLTKVVIETQFIDTNAYSLHGVGWGSSPHYNSFYVGIDGNDKVAYADGRTDMTTTYAYDFTKKTFVYDAPNGKMSVTGFDDVSFEFQNPTEALNFLLFAYNQGVNGIKFHHSRVYSAKFYVSETLVRDFIPCKNSSGKAGLYDLVGNTFYGNAGTGEFIAGPEVEIETSYVLVEVKNTYTDWQEQNIPWLSEIDRIRQNFNNLIALFLRTLDLPTFPSNVYLMYSEVNDWERVSLVSKTMFDNMEKEYVYSGTIDCGGDRLL